MTDVSYAQVWADHVISVGEPGETVTVTVQSGDTVYYGGPSVTSSSNYGSITSGNSASFTGSTWLRSASQSFVQITGQVANVDASSARTLASFNGASDGSAINAALASMGSGTLHLPGGVGIIDTTVLLGTGQHLVGQGIGNTVLKLKAGVNQDVVGNVGGRAGGASVGNDHITIRDLTVDGNKANQNQDGTKHGIYLVRVANQIYHNVEAQNVDGHGIVFDGQGTPTRGVELTNIYAHDNSQNGVWGTFAMRDTLYSNIFVYSNGLHGIELDNSEEKVNNIDARANTGRGIFIRNVFGCIYNNLHASVNGQDGIYVQGMTNSLGNNWFAANNSTSSSGTYHDINFSGDNTLSYGITTSSVVNNIQANPNGNFATTTEGYCLFVGDPTSGNFGDLKLFNVLAGTGVTGQFRTPASSGGLVIQDWPGATSNMRWWLGTGLATPNGFQLATSATHKLGFFGTTTVVQPSAVGTATGYAAGATAATFHSDDTYTGNVGTTAYTLNGVVAALKNLGLIKS